jgi:tetratricopeptide (TPR) repeat protein
MKVLESRLGKTALWVAFLVIISTGCSSKMLIRSMKPMLEKAAAALKTYDDPILLEKALPSNLISSEGYIGIDPENVYLLTSTSSTYSLYAGLIEEKDQPHAIKLYRRGQELGMLALKRNKRFVRALSDDFLDTFVNALKVLKKEDVPALYSTMSNWLPLISLTTSDSQAMMDFPKAEAIMFRILELDETHNYGAVHAALGAYYGSISKAIGGQPEKAKTHFEKAFAISNSNFLYFHVIFAQTYAVQIQDRALFVSTLKRVLDTYSGIEPGMTMANEIAKIKARALIEDVDEYFL